jgi:hypothetical protein
MVNLIDQATRRTPQAAPMNTGEIDVYWPSTSTLTDRLSHVPEVTPYRDAERMTHRPFEPAIPDGMIGDVARGAGETVLSLLPGSGEAMSAQDYFHAMDAADQEDGWDKVPHYAAAATALIGMIPLLGTISRGGRKLGEAAKSVVGALQQTDDLVAPAVGSSGIAEAAAQNRTLDPSLTVLPDDLAARATLGLPMDEPSRFARAHEQGFRTDMQLFHGAAADIPAFDLSKRGDMTQALSAREGFFFAPGPETASQYAVMAAERTGGAPVVYPVLHRAENPARLTLHGDESEAQVAETLRSAFDDAGYDAVMISGQQPLRSADPYSIVLKDPANIRSRFARFDPALANSPNLLASVGAWPFVGLGATGWQEKEGAR